MSETPLPVTGALQQKITAWEEWLAHVKRASEHTITAYHIDLEHFCRFLSTHLGAEITLKDLNQLEAKDIRAWLASRLEHFENSSTARALSTIKSFFRWLEKQGAVKNAAIFNIRSPKIKNLCHARWMKRKHRKRYKPLQRNMTKHG